MRDREAERARQRRMRALARAAWKGKHRPGRPRLRSVADIPLAERRRLEARAWASIGGNASG